MAPTLHLLADKAGFTALTIHRTEPPREPEVEPTKEALYGPKYLPGSGEKSFGFQIFSNSTRYIEYSDTCMEH